MHSVLFVATIERNKTDWSTFASSTDLEIKSLAGISRLSENVWLLDLTKTVDGFAILAGAACRWSIPYKILAFADEPQWLPAV